MLVHLQEKNLLLRVKNKRTLLFIYALWSIGPEGILLDGFIYFRILRRQEYKKQPL